MPKIRKEKAGQFTITSNKLIRDNSLSFKARGIFAYLWSQKDGWAYYESEIVKHTTDGITALRSGLNELERAGYLKRSRERKSGGRLAGTVWILSETGELKNDEKPILENLKYGNPIYENQTLRNTNQKKHQLEETLTNKYKGTAQDAEPPVPYKEIVDYLNQKTGAKYKATTKPTQRLIKARWNEGYRLDDFKKVMDNKAFEWQNNSKMWKYMRPATLFGTKFDDYLNASDLDKTRQQPTTGGYEELLNGTSKPNIPDIPDDQLPF